MAGITATEAQAHLDLWLEADRLVSSGQSYSYENRTLTRANAAEIRTNITYWNEMATRLGAGTGSRMRQAVPR